MSEYWIEWPEKKESPRNVDHFDYGGKVFYLNDKVLYIPNHAHGDSSHKDCERGVVTSLRSDYGIWIRYENQHITQPGQKTPIENLRLL